MSKHVHFRDEREQGSALIIAVMAIVIISSFSTVFLTGLLRSMKRSADSQRQFMCAQLAEAGLEKAIASLRTDPTYYRGEVGTPLGAGQFTVQVTPEDNPGTFKITSTATLTEGKPERSHLAASIRLRGDGRVQRLRWEEHGQ